MTRKCHAQFWIGGGESDLSADHTYHATYSGVPQGSIVSPILANVFLHELDLFMRTRKQQFDKEKARRINPPYERYSNKIYYLRKKGDKLKGKEGKEQELQQIKDEIRRVDQLRKRIPSKDPFDSAYKRLYYCRYADDFCIGIIGSYADAEQIRQEVRQFIQERLRLSIAEEKSHIGHSNKGMLFVGYELKTYAGYRIVKVRRHNRPSTTRSISEQMQLHIPQGKLQQFCAQKGYGSYDTNKATHKSEWIDLSAAEIILAYNGEFRGLTNYYAPATGGKTVMTKLEWMWKTSLLKTLARKHKSSVNAIAKKLRTDDGLMLTVVSEKKTRYIRIFRLKDLRKPLPNDPHLDEQPKTFIWTLSRSEVIKRLNRKQCEYCETTEGPFEVHHIRKLKDVAKGKELWQKMMAARRRKTLILCRTCHQWLHSGTLPDKEHLRKHVKGEPDASKGASPVLREGDG